jgi:hypothetical protein
MNNEKEANGRSPRITHVSWGHMEVEGLGGGRNFKLYPSAGHRCCGFCGWHVEGCRQIYRAKHLDRLEQEGKIPPDMALHASERSQ